MGGPVPSSRLVNGRLACSGRHRTCSRWMLRRRSRRAPSGSGAASLAAPRRFGATSRRRTALVVETPAVGGSAWQQPAKPPWEPQRELGREPGREVRRLAISLDRSASGRNTPAGLGGASASARPAGLEGKKGGTGSRVWARVRALGQRLKGGCPAGGAGSDDRWPVGVCKVGKEHDFGAATSSGSRSTHRSVEAGALLGTSSGSAWWTGGAAKKCSALAGPAPVDSWMPACCCAGEAICWQVRRPPSPAAKLAVLARTNVHSSADCSRG